MKIYTKTGDDGTTGLFGAARVRKDDPRIEAYGTVDELNALLGVVRAQQPPGDIDAVLARVQNDLFTVGAELATPDAARHPSVPLVTAADIERLERDIDAFEDQLAPLREFILPGGNSVAAGLHFARTVCRRAERRVVRLEKAIAATFVETQATSVEKPSSLGLVVVYLNRLSDLLFVLARAANAAAGVGDVPWQKPR